MHDEADAHLLAAYLRPERARVVALSIVLVVAMLLPVAGPVLIGAFVDRALAGDPVSQLVWIAVAYLVVAVTADALQLLVTWLAVRLAWRVGNQLRDDLAQRALDLELAWHGGHSPGLLIERIDGDIDAITKFASTAVLQLLGNAVLLVGVLAVSMVIDWRAGLLIGTAAAVATVLMVKMRSVGVAAHDHEREVLGQLYGDLEERLGGLEDLRANGAGGYAVHRLHHHSARWWKAARRSALLGDSSYVAAGCAFAVGSTLTLALGVAQHRSGALSVGAVLVLFRYAQMIREPLERIAEQMREFRKAVAGARRASRLLATHPTIVDGHGAPLPAGPLSVDFDHVTFSYDQPPWPDLHTEDDDADNDQDAPPTDQPRDAIDAAQAPAGAAGEMEPGWRSRSDEGGASVTAPAGAADEMEPGWRSRSDGGGRPGAPADPTKVAAAAQAPAGAADEMEPGWRSRSDGGGANVTVLHDVDLHLAPGTVLGVVGRTGSGKTTLGRLLLRFWDVADGAVRLGGVDLRDTAMADLRRRVAVVTQEVELVRADVRDNLTLFGTWAADDARLSEVLGDVGLGGWLAGLPEGLDTVLDGSDALSAGEAQLLAFARVLLADPGLVVLDEASSQLDPETEAMVVAATERALAGRTVVIIAHRLATLDRADEIVVLDHGRVVEHGPRAVLAARPGGRFAHLLAASAAGGPVDEVLGAVADVEVGAP